MRPVTLPVPATPDATARLREALTIPGVRLVRGSRRVEVAPDAVAACARVLGVLAQVASASAQDLPPARAQMAQALLQIRGAHRLLAYQREAAIALAMSLKTGSWVEAGKPLFWGAGGCGKTATALAALGLLGVGACASAKGGVEAGAETQRPLALVVTRALGRDAWARDSAWVGTARVALLVGREDGRAARAAAKRATRRLAVYGDGRDAADGAGCVAVASVEQALAEVADIVVVGWECLAARAEELISGASSGSGSGSGSATTRKTSPLRTWAALVLDEHHYAKNWRSERARAADRVSGHAARVWGLTATPVRDRLRDLGTQLMQVSPRAWRTWADVALPDVLGPEAAAATPTPSLSPTPTPSPSSSPPKTKKMPAFSVRYLHAGWGKYGEWDDRGPHEEGTCAHCDAVRGELAERAAFWAYVVDREVMAAQLPEKRRVFVRLPPGEGSEGEGESEGPEVRDEGEGGEGESESEGESDKAKRERRGLTARGLEAKLAAAADRKFRAVIDLAVEHLIGRAKVVLLGGRKAWVPRAAQAVKAEIGRIRHVAKDLWCEVAPEDVGARLEVCREFMHATGPAILISTAGKVSESVDLHDADVVINAMLPWNDGELDQREARFHRQGQRRKVTIYYVIAEGTVDEVVEQVVLRKGEAARGAGATTDREGWVGEVGGARSEAGGARSEAEILRELNEALRKMARGEGRGGKSA